MTVPGVLFTHCITRRVFHYFSVPASGWSGWAEDGGRREDRGETAGAGCADLRDDRGLDLEILIITLCNTNWG